MVDNRSKRRRRKAPSPNSILDQKALLEALDQRGIATKPIHIEGFYQALHRQHYPDLHSFVETYEVHERNIGVAHETDAGQHQPLKNSVTKRKNKNKQQLPKPLLNFLKDPDNGFVTLTSQVAQQKTSADGMTTKLAIELHDGQLVESVLMRYLSHDGSRASLCVSSQCGCAMGCTFCATGTMGLSGNLTTGEILEQMVHADRILAREWEHRWAKENNATILNTNNNTTTVKLDLVRNVVFMGMGEPLDNYSNVVEACRALIHRKRWNLAHGRVTVSTVGLISQIRKLTKELPEVSLALSLHAPNQDMRTAIVPTATRYPIESLVQALDEHMMAYLEKRRKRAGDYTAEERIKESSRRRAMIEYVMLEGDTSSFECAHQLGRLCENRHLLVNLIPYNQTNVKDKLKCPSWEHMEEFKSIVSSYGTFCTIRRTMGADIDSACGQLITLEQENTNSNENSPSTEQGETVKDIEDAGKTHLSSAPNSTAMPKTKPASKKSVQIKLPDTANSKPFGGSADNRLDGLVLPLAVATSISAACFVVATALFLRQSPRR